MMVLAAASRPSNDSHGPPAVNDPSFGCDDPINFLPGLLIGSGYPPGTPLDLVDRIERQVAFRSQLAAERGLSPARVSDDSDPCHSRTLPWAPPKGNLR